MAVVAVVAVVLGLAAVVVGVSDRSGRVVMVVVEQASPSPRGGQPAGWMSSSLWVEAFQRGVRCMLLGFLLLSPYPILGYEVGSRNFSRRLFGCSEQPTR